MNDTQAMINFLNQPKENALQRARQLATDDRYSAEYKAQEIRSILSDAVSTIEGRAQQELDTLNQQRDK